MSLRIDCNDPTCKEHYCQITGYRISATEIKTLPEHIQEMKKRIEELEKKLEHFYLYPKIVVEGEKKEEKYDLSFDQALIAMKKGKKVKCEDWQQGYIYLKDNEFYQDGNVRFIIINEFAELIIKSKWRIVGE